MNRKIAFIFPGQGSQYIGMGKEFISEFPICTQMIEEASEIINFNLEKACLEGPEQVLNNTSNTQPAIFTMSMMINEIMKTNGISPEQVAGHSLGEYSALAAASAISFEDGLKLVRQRGLLMDKALPAGLGSMAAIIGLSAEDILQICSKVEGVCEVANFNSPQQIVISGEKESILDAMKLAEQSGAKRVIELEVSGPFHSSLMKPAQTGLSKAINQTEINDPAVPVVANATAEYVQRTEEVKEALIAQLTNSVRWLESMELMINNGVEIFVEIGPGKVLKGLMRRINKAVKVYNVEDLKSLDKVLSVGIS